MAPAEDIKKLPAQMMLGSQTEQTPPLPRKVLHHDSASASSEKGYPSQATTIVVDSYSNSEDKSAETIQTQDEELPFFDELWKNPLKYSLTHTQKEEEEATWAVSDGSNPPLLQGSTSSGNIDKSGATTTSNSNSNSNSNNNKDKIFCKPMMTMMHNSHNNNNMDHEELMMMMHHGVASMPQVLGKGVGGGDMSQGMIMYVT